MKTKLRVLGAGRRIGSAVEMGVFCEAGPLRLGEHLTTLVSPSGQEVPVDLEVLQIRFFDHLIDELDAIYSGNVLFAEHRSGPIEKDAILK